MDAPITLGLIAHILEVIVALVAGGVAIKAILKCITYMHDRNQKLDEYDAKIQEIKDEQGLLTESMLAVLDGLHQLNCNGPVTVARDKLVSHINERAHK
jgi:hypothetical protein